MTQTHQIEIVIHVDQTLSEDQRADLVKNLQGFDGVEDARFTPGREHLMLVDYDSSKLHAKDVLGFVQKEHLGAELVGPI